MRAATPPIHPKRWSNPATISRASISSPIPLMMAVSQPLAPLRGPRRSASNAGWARRVTARVAAVQANVTATSPQAGNQSSLPADQNKATPRTAVPKSSRMTNRVVVLDFTLQFPLAAEEPSSDLRGPTARTGFRLRYRLSSDLVQPPFDHLEPAQIGLQVHDGLVQEQDLRELPLRIRLVALFGQVVKLLVEACPLGVDHLLRFGLARRQGEHQLEKELVSLVPRAHRAGQPRPEGLPARRCDGVDPFLRPGAFLHALHFDQAALLEAAERGVDLGRLDTPVGFPSHDGLKGGPQLITMPRALEKQSKQGVTDRHWNLDHCLVSSRINIKPVTSFVKSQHAAGPMGLSEFGSTRRRSDRHRAQQQGCPLRLGRSPWRYQVAMPGC